MTIALSIIIPTHNRSASLRRLLARLEEQVGEDVEVIVVADGCTDDTPALLKEQRSTYPFRFVLLPGLGAAAARNRGAEAAKGALLLFMDDDVEPSAGMIAAHRVVHDQSSEETVVIGYLPLGGPPRKDMFGLGLRAWWENKFYQMSRPGHRFTFEDLLSGNFSLPARLYRAAGGFDESFDCREDYELGLRLIKLDACFVFSRTAWGYHRDEVTDQRRSLKRKRQEGRADIQFFRRYRELGAVLRESYFAPPLGRKRKLLAAATASAPMLTDLFAAMLYRLGRIAERLAFRRRWQSINFQLHLYWYLRGVLDELGSSRKFKAWLNTPATLKKQPLDADLSQGLDHLMALVDEERPHALTLRYGATIVGTLATQPGTERLRGRHLWPLIKKELSSELLQAITLHDETPLPTRMP